MAEGSWKGNGFLDGVGIPAPSGRYRVGSVDLMVKLEGDDLGGLMVRLFYPTGASPGTGRSGDGFCYAPWFPSKNYVRGYLEFNKSKFSGIASSIISTFMCEFGGLTTLQLNDKTSCIWWWKGSQ